MIWCFAVVMQAKPCSITVNARMTALENSSAPLHPCHLQNWHVSARLCISVSSGQSTSRDCIGRCRISERAQMAIWAVARRLQSMVGKRTLASLSGCGSRLQMDGKCLSLHSTYRSCYFRAPSALPVSVKMCHSEDRRCISGHGDDAYSDLLRRLYSPEAHVL